MNSQAFLDQFVNECKQLFGNRLQAILLFGSYARGEEKQTSDVDVCCFFDVVEQETFQMMGEFVREFYPAHGKKISYPSCITHIEFSEHGFCRTFADAIKYFEGKVLYGEIQIPKPSSKDIVRFVEDIMMEVIMGGRRQITSNVPVEGIANGTLYSSVLKPLIVGLRLEKYLDKHIYPYTIHELNYLSKGLPEEKAIQWFINNDQLTKAIRVNHVDVLNCLLNIASDILQRVNKYKNK